MTSVYQPDDEPADSSLAVRRRPRALAWASVLLSVALVAASIILVDARQVLSRLEETDPRWLLGFFAVHVLQIVLLGLRWSSISHALAVPLSWRRASAEYSLSILINQLLPTGIAGDGLRALRHARRVSGQPFARILEALALDRLSGQVALLLVVLASAPFSLERGVLEPEDAWGLGAALLVLVLVLAYAARGAGAGGKLQALLRRSRQALLAPKRVAVHLPISLMLIGTLLVQLYFAARAIGIELDVRLLLWLGPLILLAASVPSFFGGWGIRESASAILFASVGFGSSTGVAVSLLFGAFALVCALPGFIVLLFEGQFSRRRWERAGGEMSWGNAHAVAMLSATAMALALRIPALITFVGVLSLLFLIVQSRGAWTPSGQFGLANAVTTLRLLLTLALLVGVEDQPPQVPAFTALTILALDLADGWLARRFAGESRFGARYDMEVDAVFVLSLSCALWAREVSGLWVLLAGLWRYLFVVVPLIIPSRGGDAPRSIYYRSAYALMVVSFVLAFVVPRDIGAMLALFGTSTVSVSFLRSFYYRYNPPQVA